MASNRRQRARKSASISELRRDIVSGDWVVIATGRARRPREFLKERRPAFDQPQNRCPFERVHPEVLLLHSLDVRAATGDWWVQAFPNKYPAFTRGVRAAPHKTGVHQWTEGVGVHEVVVTRDHTRSLAKMSADEAELVVRAYQERYLEIKKEPGVKYISIFHNHGRGSGATISHPHSQIIATPVIPPDVDRSIRGSARYFHERRACVHCLVIRYELRAKKRVVYNNEHCVVLAPFASKSAFELRIFPKTHSAHFEEMYADERLDLADALRVSLAKLHKGIRDPDYNFFLHTAPLPHLGEPGSQRAADTEEFHHYHWHFEILPKTAIWAGFEIGTGIEISTIAPETAAEFLRKIKVL